MLVDVVFPGWMMWRRIAIAEAGGWSARSSSRAACAPQARRSAKSVGATVALELPGPGRAAAT
jgi:hypothetical protein